MSTGGFTFNSFNAIDRPTLLLDEARVRANIDFMIEKARTTGVSLRPHFKTHQSAEIGEWFRERGVKAITVSSTGMAEYFADHGWRDITIAFPANIRELKRLDALAARIDLGLLIDSEQALGGLKAGLRNRVAIWIKVDVGYGRVGLPWGSQERIADLAVAVEKESRFTFRGLLTHSGHSYRADSPAAIRKIHAESVFRMSSVREVVLGRRVESCLLSIGDTPTCSLAESFPGLDEIRPGNFVFYDLSQLALGTCVEDDVAVAVACPIVGVYPAPGSGDEPGRLVIYGGAVHLAKEYITDTRGREVFGYLLESGGGGLGRIRRDLPLVSLSQEHGVVELPAGSAAGLRIGSLVFVCPVHSCLTGDLYKEYITLDGRCIPRLRHTDLP
ncbi:MAG: alanine racemase [bacterium]|nr:alanine racemase [bacterium]